MAQVHKGGAYGSAAHVEGIAEGAFHQKGTGLVFAGYDAVLNPDISLVLFAQSLYGLCVVFHGEASFNLIRHLI